jgi:type IV pilus assembly protein PilN
MARINLLPWREELRKEKQREFGVAAAGGLLLALLIGVYVHIHMAGMIDDQKGRNDYLTKEIAEVDRKIKEIKELEKTKERLLARMNVIQQLQSSRPEVVHLFDELVKTTPEGVFLTKVNQTGNLIVMDGRAQSNGRVSAFMRNVEASKWLTKPSLQLIENKDKTGTGFSHFSLTAMQVGNASKGGEQ